MQTEGGQHVATGRNYGLFLLFVGTGACLAALNIKPSAMTNPRDLDPRVFPVMLSALLGISGLLSLIGSAFTTTPNIAAASSPRAQGPTWLRGVLVLAGLSATTALMPWLGFSVCGFGLGVVLLIVLKEPWWLAVSTVAAVLVCIRVLFIEIFQKDLPAGPWGF